MPAACSCKLLLDCVVCILLPVIVMLPVLKLFAVTRPALLILAVDVVPITVKFCVIVTLFVGTVTCPAPAASN